MGKDQQKKLSEREDNKQGGRKMSGIPDSAIIKYSDLEKIKSTILDPNNLDGLNFVQ